jgi:hypothetical protein
MMEATRRTSTVTTWLPDETWTISMAEASTGHPIIEIVINLERARNELQHLVLAELTYSHASSGLAVITGGSVTPTTLKRGCDKNAGTASGGAIRNLPPHL